MRSVNKKIKKAAASHLWFFFLTIFLSAYLKYRTVLNVEKAVILMGFGDFLKVEMLSELQSVCVKEIRKLSSCWNHEQY